MSDIQDQKKKKKCKIDQYFLQFFESNTTVCFIFNVFCKHCETETEPEIVFCFDFCNKNNFRFRFRFTTLTKRVN